MKRIKQYTIEVTKEDIKKGKPNSACLCPIAIAIKRVFKKGFNDSSDIFIGLEYALHIEGCKRTVYPLPLEAREFIYNFDRLKIIKEGERSDGASTGGDQSSEFSRKCKEFKPFTFNIKRN